MVTCARCSRENPGDARFCNSCGAELTAQDAPAAEERKLVTVLFADVTGSTALGERLDAEELKEVMAAFFASMRSEIEGEGGTVEKFVGDAVMAAFGVPRTHDDDPARALRAALRMRGRLAELNSELGRSHGVRLEIRVGINTGEVMAVTDPRPGEALATGDAVNAAARLEQAAKPGQVLVAERTARSARGFRFGEPISLELRGKAGEMRALELLEEQPVTEGTLSGRLAPLVGRRRELEVLDSVYRRVVEDGRSHLVTLYGEAGVGKSRLVAELLAGLEASSPTPALVRGRCLAYGDGVTYWPLAEILKSHAHVYDDGSAESAHADAVESAAEQLARAGVADPRRAAGALAATVGLGPPVGDGHSPREVRAEAHAAWRAFFSALALDRPLVVLVEDIHWADPAMLELLEELGERTEGPALYLCTARPELITRRSSWGGGRRSFTGLDVEPLGVADSERLFGLLTEHTALSDAARAAIVQRAEGNPFFLEEIVQQLGDEGALAADAEVTVPDTVQAALAARIDLLEPEEKRTLQAASVVGRVFWPGAIREITGATSERVEELLDALQDRDLVLGRLGSVMTGQRELIFKHALVRDTAYESLPRRDRARLHAQVAAWIESAFAGRLDEVAELLAHHRTSAYRAGGSEEDRALAYAAVITASETAYGRGAVESAAALAGDAVELATTSLDRARALETSAYASFASLDGSTAWDALREAVDIVRVAEPADRQRIARMCGFAVLIPTRAPGLMRAQPTEEEVIPYLELGLECVGSEENEALVRLLCAQGAWEFGYELEFDDAERERRTAFAERAVAVAERLDRPDLVMIALDIVTAQLSAQGLFGHLTEVDARRLEIARQVRDGFEVGDAFYTAAWTVFDVGEYDKAILIAAEGTARLEDLGAQPLGTRAIESIARYSTGDWDETMAVYQRIRDGLGDRAATPPSPVAAPWGVAALIHAIRGETDEADGLLEEIAAAERANERATRWPLLWTAQALARRGELAEAHLALEKLGGVGQRIWRHRVLEGQCHLLVIEGDWEAAPGLVEEARAHAVFAGIRSLPCHADRLEGRAALVVGDPEAAIVALERSAAGFTELGAGWEIAVTELALGDALLSAGRNAEAQDALARATAVFERLRAVTELAAARALVV